VPTKNLRYRFEGDHFYQSLGRVLVREKIYPPFKNASPFIKAVIANSFKERLHTA